VTTSAVPFHLRPNKHIDRRLFVELLNRLSDLRPIRSYGYISMGGAFLEDARLMYNELSITRLLSIEHLEREHKRQLFNRPFSFVRCKHIDVDELVERYDECIQDLGDPRNVVIWLDYQDARRDKQLVEIREVSTVLQAYDVVRITMNANPTSLDDVAVPEDQLRPPTTADDEEEPLSEDMQRKQARLTRLRYQLGDFAPAKMMLKDLTRSRLPSILSQAVYQALRSGIGRGLEIQPLANFAYADLQPMLTVTAAVWPQADAPTNVNRCDLPTWPFYTSLPESIIAIRVPTLSIRERTEMDRAMTLAQSDGLIGDDGAQLTENFSAADLEQYRRFQRYYPVFARLAV
jgi:hypothetical protein